MVEATVMMAVAEVVEAKGVAVETWVVREGVV